MLVAKISGILYLAATELLYALWQLWHDKSPEYRLT